tara:strand:+ start:273 stop:563 length:291 start_codon:yes stop_codon:yes gene_type:complete
MVLKDVKDRLVSILRDHYTLDDYDFNDLFMKKTVREIDIDSIALLELFLVVEEGFGLKEKLSSKIDMETAADLSMKEFIDLVSMEVYKIYRDSLSR